MEESRPKLSELLKEKYYKVHSVTDLKDLLYKSASMYENRNAFEVKDENDKIVGISYAKFKKDVVNLGTALLTYGLKGKSIVVMGKNSYEWLVSYLAATIVGIVVPVDKELLSNDVINFINASETKAFIGDNKYVELISKEKNKITVGDIEYIDIDNKSTEHKHFEDVLKDGDALVSNGDTEFDDIVINPNELKVLLFTSGTTGNAKGVCLSHNNLVSNIISTTMIVKVGEGSRVLSVLPIHHTYECTLGNLLILFAGGTVCYFEGLKYVSKNINEYTPTLLLCVPLLLENIHKKIIKNLQTSIPKRFQKEGQSIVDSIPFFLKPIVKRKVKKSLGGKLEKFIVGAAAANPIVVEDFSKLGICVLQGYGLTECSPLAAGNNDFYQKYDSPGLPIPNVEYKIDNPNEEGIGQILVKGPNVMLRIL